MRKISQYIAEGGLAGHMAHPIDYGDFTKSDLQALVSDLFSGRIENMTEKIDGLNIQASVNKSGQTVFLRNKGDLRSGGMTLRDLASKYETKPHVQETFLKAASTLDALCQKLGQKFFWPNPSTQYTLNCECVVTGRTNIIPYSTDQVDIHGVFTYINGEYISEADPHILEQVNKALEGLRGIQLTPKVIIQITKDSQEIAIKWMDRIEKVFYGTDLTVTQWKYERFCDWLEKKAPWIGEEEAAQDALFARWVLGDKKKMTLRELRKIYKENLSDLEALEKDHKKMLDWIIEPLDRLFLGIGNDALRLCKGLINSGSQADSVVRELTQDLQNVIRDVRSGGSLDSLEKLNRQLARLATVDNRINPVEGIVFSWKGRMMKLTGSFAPLNRILGDIKWKS